MLKKEKCPNPIGRILRHGIFHDVSCKSWKCLYCSRIKKLKLMKRFEHNKGGWRYRMLTLTEWKNPENFANAKLLTQHWNRLRSSLRKKTKENPAGVILNDFLWTKEYKPLKWDREKIIKVARKFNAMKLDAAIKYIENKIKEDKDYIDKKDWKDTSNTTLFYPHIHVAVPAYIDVNLIRRLWFLATNHTADQVHIPKDDEIVVSNPVAYMTKYIMKSDMIDGFSPRERRYGCSRKYPAKELESKYSYEMLDGQKIECSFIPWKNADPNLWFILMKNKQKDEVLIRNELRIGDNYGEAKQARKELIKICDDYFNRLHDLTFEETLDYSSSCKHLKEIEDYLMIQ